MKFFRSIKSIFSRATSRGAETIEPEGIASIWGTPGFSRAVVVKHDRESKARAEKEAARIIASGGEAKTVVNVKNDDSQWADGILIREYSWSTEEVNSEVHDKQPGPSN